jgi:hypothetical protein
MAPNRYAVDTPSGTQMMTVPEWRAYIKSQPQQGISSTNLNLSPWLRERLNNPQIQAAIQRGGDEEVKVGDTKFRVRNGEVTGYATGGIWKPILAAGAVAAGGYFGPQLLGAGAPGAAGGGGSAASTAAPVTAGGAGATTAAGATGAGTAVGSRGLASWLTNPAVIGAAGTLGGAYLQTRGAGQAAEAQLQATREALAYEKERDAYLRNLEANRYATLSGQLQPYIGAGTSASNRMAELMGLPVAAAPIAGIGKGITPAAPVTSAMPTYSMARQRTTQPVEGYAVPRGTAPAMTGLVTVQAPTGETRQMPADQAQAYIARGARIV